MFRKTLLAKLMSILIVPTLLLILVPAIALADSSLTLDDGLVTWTYTVSADGSSAAITGATLDSGVTSLDTLAIPTYVPNVAGRSYVPVTSVGGIGGIGQIGVPSQIIGGIRDASVNIVRIPRYVTSLADSAFSYCSGVRSYAFDCDNLKTIGSFAFYENYALTSIDLPDTVTDLGSYAFRSDTGLVSVSLPDSLINIGDACFMICDNLPSIRIPSGVQTIGASAFSICRSLTSIDLPDTVTSIGKGAFLFDGVLTQATVASGAIGDMAFQQCTNLKSVTLGDGVTSLGDSVFSRDSALNSLTIGSGLSAIGGNVFLETLSLKSITVSEDNPNFRVVDNVLYTKDMTTLAATLPRGNATAYTVPDTVTTVARYAFFHCPNLTSVSFPQGLTAIGDYNLSECLALQRVVFKSACPTFGKACMVTDSASLTAWYPVKYADSWSSYALTAKQAYANVTWELSDGSTPNTTMEAVNSGLIAAPSDPARDGYAFGGWYDGKADGALKWDFSSGTVSDDITLYAHWTANPCVISFDSKGGSTVDSIDTVYDALLSAPIDPTLEHYTFAGWYPTSACDTAAVSFPYTVKGGVTLFAKWTPVQYAVMFNSEGGSNVDSVKADYNALINTPAAPSRTGYTFQGWYPTEARDTDAVSFPYTVTGNVTFYAKWSVQVCAVTFDSLGGSAVDGATADYGSTVSAPASPTRYGYLFVCWCADSACADEWDFSSDTVTGDTTLFTKWLSATAPTAYAASASYNSVKLTWTAVEGAGSYEVWRAVSASGTYSKAGTVTSAAYTDTGLTCGKTYYYKVRAYAGSTPVYGGYSAVVSAKPVPDTPSVTAARASSTSVKVSWKAVSGATGYEVWRATSASGTYVQRKDTTSTSFTNTGLATGTTYYYKVRAYRIVNGVKVYGNFSASASAKP